MKNPLILTLASTSTAFFVPSPAARPLLAGGGHHHRGGNLSCPGGAASIDSSSTTTTRLHFFERLDKAFEDDGPLGKGITVGKFQVALNVDGIERASGENSIFAVLEKHGRDVCDDDEDDDDDDDDSDAGGDSKLSKMCHEVCLALLRKSDDWISACSDRKWYKEQDMTKAESTYNLWADREACKFEKEHVPPEGASTSAFDGNFPTVAVISLVVEIQGDNTNFDRAGFSLAETRDVLTSLASDCRVEGGDCLNAFEVFWTPSEPTEVLTERDTIIDFPELITL
jgi:hypothetical protein